MSVQSVVVWQLFKGSCSTFLCILNLKEGIDDGVAYWSTSEVSDEVGGGEVEMKWQLVCHSPSSLKKMWSGHDRAMEQVVEVLEVVCRLLDLQVNI